MHESSLEYLRCVRCQSSLELQRLKENSQIEEGFLLCKKCLLKFPIINKVPILWDDFTSYLSNRPRLGGEFLTKVKSEKMHSYIKRTLGNLQKNLQDQSLIEQRWYNIYRQNQKSQFYLKVRSCLDKISKHDIALEHGCSIGTVTKHLAKNHKLAFGIDKSYHAISEAKKSVQRNLDFFVADSLEHPFGKTKFDLVVGLNLFELIEPKQFLKILASQIRKNGWFVISDPYDFDRGLKSVREPLYEDSLRSELSKIGFAIAKSAKKPSNILWNLKLHKRASLLYKVDLIFGRNLR